MSVVSVFYVVMGRTRVYEGVYAWIPVCLCLFSWTTHSSLTSSEPEGPVCVKTSTSLQFLLVSYGFGGCNLKSTDDHYELENCQKRITEQLC